MLLLEGLFYMSCIEAVHHLGGTRRRQELHLCWQQLKLGELSCMATGTCRLPTMSFCTDKTLVR